MIHAIALNAKTTNPQRVPVIAKITQNHPNAPKARPSPNGRFSRRERWIPVRANARLENLRSRWSLAVLQTPQNRFSPYAPKARPSSNGRFSRRERAAPRSISAGETAGFSRRITESYASRDSAKRQNNQPATRSRYRQNNAKPPHRAKGASIAQKAIFPARTRRPRPHRSGGSRRL